MGYFKTVTDPADADALAEAGLLHYIGPWWYRGAYVYEEEHIKPSMLPGFVEDGYYGVYVED